MTDSDVPSMIVFPHEAFAANVANVSRSDLLVDGRVPFHVALFREGLRAAFADRVHRVRSQSAFTGYPGAKMKATIGHQGKRDGAINDNRARISRTKIVCDWQMCHRCESPEGRNETRISKRVQEISSNFRTSKRRRKTDKHLEADRTRVVSLGGERIEIE